MEEGYLAKIVRGDGSKEIKVGEVLGSCDYSANKCIYLVIFLFAWVCDSRKESELGQEEEIHNGHGTLLIIFIDLFTLEGNLCGVSY